jgi:diguanylate cyclase (GGDEF)-like protein
MTLKKILLGGKPQDDPIDAVKRKMFLLASPIGCLSMLIVWGIGLKQNYLTVLDVFFLPILAILLSIFVILLWRNIIHLSSYELIVYALVLVYTLANFIAVILAIILKNGSFNSDFALWLPFVYILSFLILSTSRALLISAIFFTITLLLGLVAYLDLLFRSLPFPNSIVMMQIYLASAFYIAVLYLVARIKERYFLQRTVADNMSKLAMIDPLTQVDNRRLLTQLLQEEVSRTKRQNLPLSVILFDLDWFKKINDTYGHNTGDKILQEVAQLLRQNIRTSDPFGRWGGDEFLCLAINSDGEQAVELAKRLRDSLQRHHFSLAKRVTASFGVTTYQDGDTPETLIRRADLGLYKAKAGGRNRVEVVIAGTTLPLFEGEKPYSVPDDKEDYRNLEQE